MTAAANGKILDGNARLEQSAQVFGDVEPIVVEHDGTRPVIMVRTDIPDESAPRARSIIVTANRVAEANLTWDKDVLRSMHADGVDLSTLWGENDLHAMLGSSPDFAPGTQDDQGQLDSKTPCTCPNCGHEFFPEGFRSVFARG